MRRLPSSIDTVFRHPSTLLRPLVGVVPVALLSLAGCTTPAGVDGGRLVFVQYATFFSAEGGRTDVIDPQVFVVMPGAPAATGPQDIAHAENLRNASPSDALATRLYTANGKPLELTVGQWVFARGSATLATDADGTQRIAVTLDRLKPGGAYSVSTTRVDRQPAGQAPLDHDAATNPFVADAAGHGAVTVVAPRALTHDDAVLVVYRSDGAAGATRGTPGVDAHDLLIARVP